MSQEQVQGVDPNSLVMEGMFSESADVELGAFGWAEPGNYPVRIVKAEPQLSKKGIAMLALQLTIEGHAEFEGVNIFDYICLKGGGGDFWARASKKKLLGLGIHPNSDAPVPATAVAQALIGKLVYVDLDVEPRKGRDASGAYTLPQFTVKNGVQVQQMQNRALDYYTTPINGRQAQQTAPQAQNGGFQQAPQQLQQPVQNGGFQGPPPGYVQQGAPQQVQGYAPPAPGGHVAFPGGQNVAPQGWNNAPPPPDAAPPKGRSRKQA